MDLTKNIKLLSSEADWPFWKKKMKEILDYHERAIDVIEGTLVNIELLPENVSKVEKQVYELYRKSNSFAKSMTATTVIVAICILYLFFKK